MNKDNIFKLTNPQKSIWLTEEYYKGTNINTICGTLFIKEKVNVNLLKETIKKFIKINDSMRTRIIVENGVPKQFISNAEISEIEVCYLNNEQDLKKLENKIAQTPLNIINSELFIFKVFKLNDGTGGIIGHLHHLIADAWSFGIMTNQLKNIYESLLLKTSFDEIRPSYLEYIEKEKNYFESDKYLKDKEYWENSFSQVPDLATIKPYRNNITNQNSNRFVAQLSQSLCNKINNYAKDNNSSAYSFLLSIFSIYLARVSGIDNVIIGTPFLNRSNFKEKNTMGMFVNTLPNKLNLDWNSKFTDFLKYTAEQQKIMFRHSKYPYDKLLERIRKEQDLNRNLFDISLSFQNARNDSQDSNIKYCTYWNYCGNISESLEIHVFDMNNTGSLQLFYDYQTSKFDEDEIRKINNRILHIIEQVIENDIYLKDIQIVTDIEKKELLYDFNNTKTEYPRNKTISQVFEEQVELNPNKPAIVFENKTLIYKEFNKKCNQLARHLQSQGVTVQDKVMILADKSIDLYIAIMAILKLGAIYVPIDIEYPKDRIKMIMQDCNPKCVIIDEKYKNSIECENKCTIPLDGLEKYSTKNLETTITSRSRCLYYIYLRFNRKAKRCNCAS